MSAGDDRSTPWAATPSEVLRDPTLHPTAKAVFAVLATYADEAGVAWPSVKTLATDLAMSPDTVDRHLRSLRDYGLITWVVRRTAKGRRRHYHLWRIGHDRGDWPALQRADDDGGVTAPVQGSTGGVTAPQGQGVTAPQGQEQEPGTKKKTPPGEPGDGSALFDLPAPAAAERDDDEAEARAATPMPTGRDLFAAYIDGYRAAHDGADPDPAIHGQLRGRVREVVQTRTDLASWRHAWRAFKAAGRDGTTYVARYLLMSPNDLAGAAPRQQPGNAAGVWQNHGATYDPAALGDLPPVRERWF